MKNLANLKALLQTPKHICIITHKNPDGDAVGSSLALKLSLQKLNHHVTAIVPNDFPSFLKWIPHQEQILRYDKNQKKCQSVIEEADLIFTLDFNDLSRCGDVADELKDISADFVMIDHHQQPSDYAKFKYSDDKMGSTCEMIFHFLEKLELLHVIDADIATCIYVGIMTDTGSFRFPATTNKTHQVVAKLIEAGADNTAIHQQTFDVNSYQRMQLLGVALNNLTVLPEYKTAFIHLNKKELMDHDYKKGDTEGFVNYGLSLQDVVFAVIFIESLDEELIKISFRSKGDFDVNQFARNYFEGGGHKNAAGGRSLKNLTETLSYFKEKLSLQTNLKQ
jgi:phosphoesterase RecJ-like protein